MQTRHTSAPGFSCESLQHTHGTTKVLAATCLKHNRVFLGLRCNFLKATIMSYLQVTVYYLPLRVVRSVHQCSAKPSQKTTPNGTFFRKIVARYWKNRVVSFLRRGNQSYSSVVICVSAPRRWLLCCCERRLDTSRQASENPVTECPLTR